MQQHKKEPEVVQVLETIQDVINGKPMNNLVFIDIGDTNGEVTQKEFKDGNNNIVLVPNRDFSGYAYVKRSGKVLNACKDFSYRKPYNPRKNPLLMQERLRNVCVQNGDNVFFEVDTKPFCNRNKLIYQIKDGNYVYAVPYRLLICAFRIDKKTGKENIVMLNGKVMVERNLEIAEDKFAEYRERCKGLLVFPEKEYDNSEHNWCVVTEVNNDEGYEGTLKGKDYVYWNKKDQDLEKGWLVLVKKYASFDLQNATKEHQDINRLQDVYSVDRHKILAFKKSEGDVARPYGMYFKVALSEDFVLSKDKFVEGKSGILVKNTAPEFLTGKVVDVGCGVDSRFVDVGLEIKFPYKAGQIKIIDNFAFVNILSVQDSPAMVK